MRPRWPRLNHLNCKLVSYCIGKNLRRAPLLRLASIIMHQKKPWARYYYQYLTRWILTPPARHYAHVGLFLDTALSLKHESLVLLKWMRNLRCCCGQNGFPYATPVTSFRPFRLALPYMIVIHEQVWHGRRRRMYSNWRNGSNVITFRIPNSQDDDYL